MRVLLTGLIVWWLDSGLPGSGGGRLSLQD